MNVCLRRYFEVHIIFSVFVFALFCLISPFSLAGEGIESTRTIPQRADQASIVQIERGNPFPPLDFLAHILALPGKLILWNRRFANHGISPETEKALRDYVEKNKLYEVKFRLNQWAPHDEMKRLFTNRKMGLPYRLIAIPFTLVYSSTGRLLGGLILSDYYDPYSNTVHVFSDDVAIALHEAGHAKDFHYRKWRGTYALTRMLPGFNLFQESFATDEALDYLKITDQRKEYIRAYKILYPAYATYIGSYLPAYPIGYLGALIGGHYYGRRAARLAKEEFEMSDYRRAFRKGEETERREQK